MDPDKALELVVRPSDLTASGQSAQQLAQAVPGEDQALTEASGKAEGGLKGWTTATALHNCTANWATLLNSLAGDLGRYGTKLQQIAQSYGSSDRNIADDLDGTAARTAASTSPSTPGPSRPDPFNTVIVGDQSAKGR
ncbi:MULTISPECIES: hypothetical protein [unclassified Kitasatospora]|uniref:hypothetical protein n=1 Tax=unclassified Kitasatospora TaxID=2633591 RepID=UPI0033EB1594